MQFREASKNDYDIFSELSGKLNCKEKFTHNQSSDEWIKNIYDKFYKQSKDQGIKVLNFETLKEKNFENPRSEIEWFLCSLLDCNRIDIYLRFEEPLIKNKLEI